MTSATRDTTTGRLAEPIDPPSVTAGSSRRAWVRAHAASIVFWSALAAGVAARVVRYVDNRSLWLDESFLAINLIDRTAGELLDALDFAQSAPPAFLLSEKGIIDILGDSERSLRLLPFVASIVALLLFAWLTRRLLSPWAATLALALFAANDFLVYQASEVKPYSTDVLMTVVLLALLVQFERGPATLGRIVPLLAAGAVAPFVSFPSVLVLGGVGTAALLVLHQRGTHRTLLAATGLMGAWLAAFAVVLMQSSTTIQRVSSEIFAGQPTAGQGMSQSIERSWSLFVNPGNFTDGTNALAALLAAFGILEFVRRDRAWQAIALGVPPALAFGAAVLERYPLGNRYSLFLVPIMLLLVARGVEALVRDSKRAVLLATALAMVLLVPQAATALRHATSPPRGEDVRPLLATAASGWRAGDVLYLYRNAQYAARYYGTCNDCRPDGIAWPWPTRPAPPTGTGEQFAPALESVPPSVVVGTQESLSDRIASDVARLPTSGRVWALLSHVTDHEDLNEGALLQRELAARGRLVRSWHAGDAELLLYELSR
jgi:hypothetical protein